MTAPDRDLLAAVAAAVHDSECGCGGPHRYIAIYVDLAEAAVAAAGRVLAERLRAEADRRDHDVQQDPYGGVSSEFGPGLRGAATAAARWCGAEPEGAAPGNTPSPACTDSFHAALVDRFDAMVEAGRAERDEATADDTLDVFSAAAEAEAERLAVECAVEGRGDVPEPVARDLAIIAVRTALGAPGVRREVERRNDLITELSRSRDGAVGAYERARDEAAHLAAALADARAALRTITDRDATEPRAFGNLRAFRRDVAALARAALAEPAGATEGTGE